MALRWYLFWLPQLSQMCTRERLSLANRRSPFSTGSLAGRNGRLFRLQEELSQPASSVQRLSEDCLGSDFHQRCSHDCDTDIGSLVSSRRRRRFVHSVCGLVSQASHEHDAHHDEGSHGDSSFTLGRCTSSDALSSSLALWESSCTLPFLSARDTLGEQPRTTSSWAAESSPWLVRVAPDRRFLHSVCGLGSRACHEHDARQDEGSRGGSSST